MPTVSSTSIPASGRKSTWGRRTGLWLGSTVVVAVTLGVLAWLGWAKYSEIQQAMNMPPPPPPVSVVGVRNVGTVSWRNSTGSTGTIFAPRSITVNNELPGTVAQVLFEPGAIVEEGSVLLEQDSTVEQAQLKAAKVREHYSGSALERSQKLARSDAIAINELEELESGWRQAQAEVEELQAIIARKTIVAPFRARAGLSDVHKGQYLAAGSMITTLQSVEDHLLVEFTLPQNVINQLQLQDTVKIVSPGVSLSAAITAVDAQADRQTRNVRVRARIDSPPASLSPGDSVQVQVEFGPGLELPAVPAEAVRRSPQGTFVFMVETSSEGKHVASARPVVLATSVGSLVGIASGVAVGEAVVVDGSFKLQDGALITWGETDQQPKEDP